MSMMPAATSQRAAALCMCVFCCQQVALWGGRVACVDCNCDCDCDVDVANLDLDLETRWRFWGELGAFYVCVSLLLLLFLSFLCLLLFSFSFFLHVSWHEVLKSKACIVWVVALCVCV